MLDNYTRFVPTAGFRKLANGDPISSVIAQVEHSAYYPPLPYFVSVVQLMS